MLTGIRNGNGSLGKFLVDEDADRHLDNSLANLDRLTADIQAGKGTLGELVSDDEMYNKVDSATGRLDAVLEAVQDQQGTLVKLVYNSDFHDSAKSFLDNGNALIEDVRAVKGTFGKLVTDDSLYTQYRQVGENLSSATAKLNSNETTRKVFLGSEALLQHRRSYRRHAADDGRSSKRPEEIPAREVFDILRMRGARHVRSKALGPEACRAFRNAKKSSV